MLEGIFPLLLSVVILLGILYLAYISSRYLGNMGNRQSQSKSLKILDSIALGQDRSLAAVKVGERVLLLGITSGGITNLAELEKNELQATLEQEQQIPPRFNEILNRLYKK